MPLCREAVQGPGVYAGFGIPQFLTVPIRPPSRRLGGETEGESEDTTHASQVTRPKGRA